MERDRSPTPPSHAETRERVRRDAANHTLTYCCIDTTSRHFARFGLLFERNGAWEDGRVVSEQWVADSLKPSPSFEGYGYKWWLLGREDNRIPEDTYAAIGVDEQYIYVIPSLELVVVRNGIYKKHDGEPVADPNLFGKLPAFGLQDDLGSVPPDSWDDAQFLTPIVDSITD